MHISPPNEYYNPPISDKQNRKEDTIDTQMTVYFVPQFLSINPYQKQLAEALENLGVQLEGVDKTKIFLPTAIKAQGAKIIHLHWLHPYFSAPEFNKFPALRFLRPFVALFTCVWFILGLIILKIMGIKLVWTAHNLASHESLFPRLDYFCHFTIAYLSDSIIAHCHAAKKTVIEKFRIKAIQKIIVIPHGHYIDYYQNSVSRTDARKKIGLRDDSLAFLFLGLIRPYKGVLELMDAFVNLEDESVDQQLIVAGKTSVSMNRNFANQVQRKSEISNNITYIPGFIPDEKIQVYMNACDVVVFPYRDVLTSGAVILAMSFGKPCIAPKKGCIGEALVEAGAFLYDPSQAGGLPKAMIQAATHRANLPQMGKYNQQAIQDWNWELIARQTNTIYQKCLNA